MPQYPSWMPGADRLNAKQADPNDQVLQDNAIKMQSPLFASLNRMFNAQIDPTRRNVLAGYASRGMGLSGMANKGIAGALADLESKRRQEEMDLANQIRGDTLAAREQDLKQITARDAQRSGW